MYKVITYSTESGGTPLKDFIEKVLKKKHKTKDIEEIKTYINMLGEFGFQMNQKYRSNSIMLVVGDIYELRPGGNRVMFFHFSKDGKFVLLHGFEKTTQKTPPKEKERARNERDDYIRRN